MNLSSTAFAVAALTFTLQTFAASPFGKNLPRGLAPFESPVIFNFFMNPSTTAPVGPVRSLGEWEEAESVMTLWDNASWVKALTENGKVTLIADDASAQSQWQQWLGRNQIDSSRVNYFLIPTDSIWVRDYGPWWILDGQNRIGIVDTTYNRPRYQDDKVPSYIAQKLNIPLFDPSLVHTGGNYYSDSDKKAFSSTLVLRENSGLSEKQINDRMFDFLGIEQYTTSPLGVRVTIEHLDTFGKLVSPDTWVFSDFPAGSRFKADSDRMVEILKTQTSSYGTPYKIFRMPMVKRNNYSSEDYRAYINSFVSNGVLYFPTYGDSNDQRAKDIYQAALPGYKIVGVDNKNTEWGDSVHCRSRNLIKRNTIFIFPRFVNENGAYSIDTQIVASPGARVLGQPTLNLMINGQTQVSKMNAKSGDVFSYSLGKLKSGDVVKFSVQAEDSNGIVKMAPRMAPAQMIELQVP